MYVIGICKQGVDSFSILALTFTNKAAREMKARIAQIVGESESKNLWMGTFHSVFARILRARPPYWINFVWFAKHHQRRYSEAASKRNKKVMDKHNEVVFVLDEKILLVQIIIHTLFAALSFNRCHPTRSKRYAKTHVRKPPPLEGFVLHCHHKPTRP